LRDVPPALRWIVTGRPQPPQRVDRVVSSPILVLEESSDDLATLVVGRLVVTPEPCHIFSMILAPKGLFRPWNDPRAVRGFLSSCG
jgi:hypothetical protein